MPAAPMPPAPTDRGGSRAARTHAALLPPRPWLLRAFHRIAERRLRKNFRAVRLANADAFARAGVDPRTEPLVFYLNHPSWWDPLAGFVLARHLIGRRPFYAPMDAEALQRYRLLAHLGMFPVEMDSPRGAAQFLQMGDAVLQAGYVLAVTAQGQFTDVRATPLQLKPGLAALLDRRARTGKQTTVVPLALEYTFWDQRLPECLAMVGEVLSVGQGEQRSRTELQTVLESRLAAAQQSLAVLAMRRQPDDFRTIVEGNRGVAGFYSLWERLKSLAGRQQSSGDHQVVHAKHSSRDVDR